MIYSEFIYGNYIDTSVCDSLVDYYEKCPNKQPGKVGGVKYNVNPDYKDSMDIGINPRDENPIVQNYLNELKKILIQYKERYVWCDKNQGRWSLVEDFNVQRYLPGQGFKVWHFERTSTEKSIKRHLVFMTYLNDVNDGGETEWLYQNIKIKPKKGLTVVWPAEWTFTHRGVVSLSETKYIATGWYSFNGIEEGLNDIK